MNEPCFRHLHCRQLEHLLLPIQACNPVAPWQLLEHRARAASEFVHALRLRMVLLDQRTQVASVLSTVTLHRIVETREDLIAHHRATPNRAEPACARSEKSESHGVRNS